MGVSRRRRTGIYLDRTTTGDQPPHGAARSRKKPHGTARHCGGV